ncbi:MAG: hypothetical protein MJA82_15730 [Clostridia bacterium]|nr:hypothetical protein [Clostridia bacterium]
MTLENEGNKKIIMDDKDIMQIVLDNYHHGFTSQKSIVSVHIDFKNDDRAHMYGSFYKNEVPEMIKKLFK